MRTGDWSPAARADWAVGLSAALPKRSLNPYRPRRPYSPRQLRRFLQRIEDASDEEDRAGRNVAGGEDERVVNGDLDRIQGD